MSRASIALPPTGPHLSIFDFDGTLFRSPAPTEAALAKYPNAAQPTFTGGLGWFQSARTLDPPFVPQRLRHMETSCTLGNKTGKKEETTTTSAISTAQPTDAKAPSATAAAATPPPSSATAAEVAMAIDHFDRWFIAPTVAAYMEAKSNGHKTAILTGREKTFTKRIQQIVEDCGFQFDHLFTKQNPRGGTVSFKVDVFISLIVQYQPKKITYYEDRVEQGEKIVSRLSEDLKKRFPADVAQYYTDNFEMIMVDPSLSDSLLEEAAESELLEALLADAKAEAEERRSQRNNGGGGGRGGGRRR